MLTTTPAADATGIRLWTAEEFLEWLAPGRHADLIDGEKFMHSPVNLRHAKLLNFLDHLLRSYIERKKLGELYREVVAVRLSSRNVFLPDLAFFTNEQVALLQPAHAPMAPTFVVEAISPRTFDRDLGPKFATYEEHGVQEYWVLDPETLAHRFFRREGEFLVEFAQGEEVIRAQTIPGFWIKRAWLNPETPPEVAGCLDEILRGQPR
ncbi:MAG: Uma2 family endonuclease [Verrucomicrobiota bacterium]|nr:Uma2 family endonuclease [Verrucomicrobiota bacterium]